MVLDALTMSSVIRHDEAPRKQRSGAKEKKVLSSLPEVLPTKMASGVRIRCLCGRKSRSTRNCCAARRVGVNFEIKNHAAAIAEKGYRALIPNLCHGKIGLDAAEALHLYEDLDWQGAVKDVVASVKWLKENGSPKVGITGFCMGGELTLASAVLVHEVDAVVAFYGTPNPELADLSKVKVPVQAHFGEQDSMTGFSDPVAAKGLEEKLKVAGVPWELFTYPGQGHSFMNSSEEAIKQKIALGFADHDQDAVNLAWSRFDVWFDKYLKV